MAPAAFDGFMTALSSGESRHPTDLESGGGSGKGFEAYGSVCDPFEFVSTKSEPVDRLKRWRQAALVLNASRRYRYTLDLKMEEEERKKNIVAKIRTHAEAIRAAYLFQAHVEKPDGKPLLTRTLAEHPSAILIGNHNAKPQQLDSMTRDRDFSFSQNVGVVKEMTDPDKGDNDDDELNISVRKSMFGSNTYPRKKVRRNMANVHYNSDTLTSRVGENARSAHPRDWMFGDNFGKWVAFIGTYCTTSAVLLAFIALKFSGTLSTYETYGWFLIASIVAHAMTISTSWLKFYTANDLRNPMKENLSPVSNKILNSVIWFSAIISYLSLLLVVILPHKILWVGYAVLCLLFVVIFVLSFIGLIKVFWERARPDEMEAFC